MDRLALLLNDDNLDSPETPVGIGVIPVQERERSKDKDQQGLTTESLNMKIQFRALQIAHELRNNKNLFQSEISLDANQECSYQVQVIHGDETSNLKKQMKIANRSRLQCVLLIGSDELRSGHVLMRNLSSGEQVSVDIGNEGVSALARRILSEYPRGALV